MVNLNPFGDNRIFGVFIPEDVHEAFAEALHKEAHQMSNLFGDQSLLLSQGGAIPLDKNYAGYVELGGCYLYCLPYLKNYCWTLADLANSTTDLADLTDVWDGFAEVSRSVSDCQPVDFDQVLLENYTY